MRKNEFYTADILINGSSLRPGYLGSIEHLAIWAYNIYLSNIDKQIQLTAKKVIHTGSSQTHLDIPPLDNTEINEVLDLASKGNLAPAWLFTELGLLLTQGSQP